MPNSPPYATRQYSYEFTAADASDGLRGGGLFRFVLGRDPRPVEIVDGTGPRPDDPFWNAVLAPGARPQTLRALREALGDRVPVERSYVVGEGAQLPADVGRAQSARDLRLIVTRADPDAQPDVLVATAPRLDDAVVFLQVIGWDGSAGAYQFYERRHGAWVWAGSSFDALSPGSRRKGPFDSHVNGGLNMKEMKAPWLHWHSQSAEIRDAVLADEDPLLRHELWTARSHANRFELEVVRPGIRRWTRSRLERSLASGRLEGFRIFFRHLATTTTVNLVSTLQESRILDATVRLLLPTSFFLDADALFGAIGLEPDIQPVALDGARYAACLRRFDVHLSDGTRRFDGDTHFAFAVPERAFEDLVVVEELLARGIVSDRLAAAILMVDFSNPIFSARRERLRAHVPDVATPGDAAALERAVVASLERAPETRDAGTPEAELAGWLRDPQWRTNATRAMEAFFEAVANRLVSDAGVDDLFALADSRRREFRRRPLAEFPLTLPASSVTPDAPLLEMRPDASVRPK